MSDFEYPSGQPRMTAGDHGQPAYSDWPTTQVLPPPPAPPTAGRSRRIWPVVVLAMLLSALVSAAIAVPVARTVAMNEAPPVREQAQPTRNQETGGDEGSSEPDVTDDTQPSDEPGPVQLENDASPVEVIAASVLPSVAKIDVAGPQPGSGSAVVFREDGYLVTNAHVVSDASEVRVTFADGQPRRADVIGTAAFTDLAVIKVEGDDLPAPLFAEQPPRVGRLAVAIGSPFGLDATVTSGIVSALDRELSTDEVTLSGLIQTDAAINPGNSGGALVDDQGRIIGINTAIFSSSRSNAGVGFAIPSSIVVPIADKVISDGDVVPAFLGINGDDVTPEVAESFGTTAGALAVRILDGTPAADAGLREGDIITAIDDVDILSMIQLSSEIQRRSPGETVTLDIVRDGDEQQIDVTLTERPSTPAG